MALISDQEQKRLPFLRWAGSKRKLLPKLKGYWQPDHKRYVEPFMGSACLFFALDPPIAILSDINKGLVETYITLRDHPLEVYEAASMIEKNEEKYYSVRAVDPSTLDPVHRAGRFIYLNRFCFNGLYRTNNRGQFNVPYGHSKTGGLPKFEVFDKCSTALKKAVLCNGDFESVIASNVRAGDFVYLDPPFAMKNRRIFTQYDARSFGVSDLNRLANLLDKIVDVGADFLLSYAACEEVYEHFGKRAYQVVNIQRNISGFASYRKLDQEIIMTSIRLD